VILPTAGGPKIMTSFMDSFSAEGLPENRRGHRVLQPPNAARQARPKAGAQRTLEGVAWTRLLGTGDGRDTVLTRLLHRPRLLYPFNSFFSSLKKRQSVPWAMSFCGVDLMSPTSCRRRAKKRTVSSASYSRHWLYGISRIVCRTSS